MCYDIEIDSEQCGFGMRFGVDKTCGRKLRCAAVRAFQIYVIDVFDGIFSKSNYLQMSLWEIEKKKNW